MPRTLLLLCFVIVITDLELAPLTLGFSFSLPTIYRLVIGKFTNKPGDMQHGGTNVVYIYTYCLWLHRTDF